MKIGQEGNRLNLWHLVFKKKEGQPPFLLGDHRRDPVNEDRCRKRQSEERRSSPKFSGSCCLESWDCNILRPQRVP